MLAPLLLLAATQIPGYANDTVLPHHTPRDCNCSAWADAAGQNATFVASLWSSAASLRRAGAACAFPANAVTPLPNASSAHLTGDGWCLCDGAGRWTWCNPPAVAPSQINLLVINATAVGVSFVTADEGRTAGAAAVVELRAVNASAVATVSGFSTRYTDPANNNNDRGKRHLSYHHVILAGLRERTEYEYRVRSGAAGSAAGGWSAWKRFRSLYSDGVTRLAMYGDMGVFPATEQLPKGFCADRTRLCGPTAARNNIGNLIDDVAAGRIDWVVHSGDHAYEFEENDRNVVVKGSRGDGYMDSYEALLAHAPWAPGFGNHEYLRGDKANRLLNITAGLVAGMRSADSNSKSPPKLPMTAQWYSVNIGVLHLVHLDFSPYWCNVRSGCSLVAAFAAAADPLRYHRSSPNAAATRATAGSRSGGLRVHGAISKATAAPSSLGRGWTCRA